MYAILRIGQRGPDVQHLQRMLNFVQAVAPLLVVDGIFGPQTQAAVVSFQKRWRLKDDGICGPNTGKALVAVTLQAATQS